MSSVTEETKQSLHPGDPQGGHTTHDTSPVFQTGTLPEVEQDIYDEREAEREAQEQAVADNEDAVAKERAEVAEGEQPKDEKESTKSSTSKSSSSSSSSTSSSS